MMVIVVVVMGLWPGLSLLGRFLKLISCRRTLSTWTRKIVLIDGMILAVRLVKIFGLTVHGLEWVGLLRRLLLMMVVVMVVMMGVVCLATILLCQV